PVRDAAGRRGAAAAAPRRRVGTGRMMRAPLAVALLLLASSCPPGTGAPDLSPITLSLGLRPKPSCDLTPVQYETDCLAAVVVEVVPAGPASPQRACTRLE